MELRGIFSALSVWLVMSMCADRSQATVAAAAGTLFSAVVAKVLVLASQDAMDVGTVERLSSRVPNPERRGLSLLEVMLALAILAVATAYLAASMEQATSNALKAQNLTQAELVAESVMNQVIAGVIPTEAVSWTPYSNSFGPTEWMYQVQPVATEVDGMLAYQVAVQRVDANVGLVQAKVDLFANRWIIDPALGLDTPPVDDGYGGEGYGGEGNAVGSGGTASGGASGGASGAAAGAMPAGGGFAPGGPGGPAGGGRGAGPGGGRGAGPGGGRGGGAGDAGGRGAGGGGAGGRPAGGARGGGPAGGGAGGRAGGGGFGPGGPGGGFGPGGPGGGGPAGQGAARGGGRGGR